MSLRAPRRPLLAAAGAVVFVATAALVSTGAAGGLDRYAVRHLMPWLRPQHHPLLDVRSLVLPDVSGSAARALVDLWTYPAAALPSLALVLVCAFALHRRGRARAAWTWCAVWVAGNAVELAGKLTLERPPLFRGRVHLVAFDGSLPSGHTIRSLVVAAALAGTWRWGRLAFLCAAGVVIALVPLGAHTPTDVLGGAGVAGVLLAWAPAAQEGGVPPIRAARVESCDCSEPHTSSQSANTPSSATR